MFGRSDQTRDDRLAALIAEHHLKAGQARSERERAFHGRAAPRLGLTRRTQRMFPMSIWLWGASIVVVILPWSILARAGHPATGWAVSAVVLVGLVLVRWRATAETEQARCRFSLISLGERDVGDRCA